MRLILLEGGASQKKAGKSGGTQLDIFGLWGGSGQIYQLNNIIFVSKIIGENPGEKT